MGKCGANKLSWLAVYYDCNADKIKYYDIFKYREDDIKKLKKKCATKEAFAEKMRRELMYYFWSRAEWEMIIEIDDNGRVWLSPWCGCRDTEKAKIDVSDRIDFDWRGLARKHIGKQIYKNKAKIDVWDQVESRFDELVDYVWYTRLRYERKNSKFDA